MYGMSPRTNRGSTCSAKEKTLQSFAVKSCREVKQVHVYIYTCTFMKLRCSYDLNQGRIEVCVHLHGEGWVKPARDCLLYTSPSPRDATLSRMPSSA